MRSRRPSPPTPYPSLGGGEKTPLLRLCGCTQFIVGAARSRTSQAYPGAGAKALTPQPLLPTLGEGEKAPLQPRILWIHRRCGCEPHTPGAPRSRSKSPHPPNPSSQCWERSRKRRRSPEFSGFTVGAAASRTPQAHPGAAGKNLHQRLLRDSQRNLIGFNR